MYKKYLKMKIPYVGELAYLTIGVRQLNMNLFQYHINDGYDKIISDIKAIENDKSFAQWNNKKALSELLDYLKLIKRQKNIKNILDIK
tara:strand:+ start:353 stop:616 length:264 start_codon:yes stop_codon:yes gene_type:complete